MAFVEYFKYYDDYEKEYNNVVVFMEMGTFMCSYEHNGVGRCVEVGRLLTLAVTQPNTKLGLSIQNPHMIGFPKSSTSKYIPVLLKHNYSVVWIEQENVRGKITRKKTRVFTPGTFFEEPLTNEDYHVCCIHSIDQHQHYATVMDTSVGKVEIVTLNETRNLNWFCCVYKPYEILCLCDEGLYAKIESRMRTKTKAIYLKNIAKYPEYFIKSFQQKMIQSAYTQTRAMQDIPFEYLPSMVCLIQFVQLCHERALEHLAFPAEPTHQGLTLHNNALHQLDVVETSRGGGLFRLIDKTSTPMGSRLLCAQLKRPMTNTDDIQDMYDRVEAMIPNIDKVRTHLKGIPDLDRKIKRLQSGHFSMTEIVSLVHVFQNVLSLYEYDEHVISHVQHIETFVRSLVDVDHEQFIHPETLLEAQRAMTAVVTDLEKHVRFLTNGLDFELKTDLVAMNVTTTPKRATRLGKTIRVKKKRAATVDVTNDTIDQYIHDYQYAKEKYDQLYAETLSAFQKEWFRTCHAEMTHLSRVVADVDAVLARSACVVEYNYTRPVIDLQETSFVRGEQIRHPIIERQSAVRYVANDVELTKGMLLYGINGAGKSSYGRAVALNVILAQAGFFVPAKTFTFSPYERLYTRIGSDDNLYEGLSSFWLEITEMNGIIRSGNHKSLVIGDELFKGTEDVSAMALVSACLRWLCEHRVSFIFATHLHKLPQIQIVKALDLRIMHMRSEYCKETKSIVFNRTWCEGQGESNYGIEVAEYILDDPSIIHHAKMVRHELCGTAKKGKQSKYNRDVWVEECTHCKSKQNLHTHHIQPQKDCVNNKASNLIPLCEDCHQQIHANLLSHEVMDGINGPIHRFKKSL